MCGIRVMHLSCTLSKVVSSRHSQQEVQRDKTAQGGGVGRGRGRGAFMSAQPRVVRLQPPSPLPLLGVVEEV